MNLKKSLDENYLFILEFKLIFEVEREEQDEAIMASFSEILLLPAETFFEQLQEVGILDLIESP